MLLGEAVLPCGSSDVDAEMLGDPFHDAWRQHPHAQVMPIRASSFGKARHQFISVLTDTLAQSASCCFVIAFIKKLHFFMHPRLRLSIKQAFCVRLAREFITPFIFEF